MRLLIFLLALSIVNPLIAAKDTAPATLAQSAITNFTNNPEPIKKILSFALDLTTKNLHYQFGSADPKTQGMDCSGTVYYILNSVGVHDVPRSSDLQYVWAKEKGHFHFVNSIDIKSTDFKQLKPGDLLFWSGTYDTKRATDVSHVMLYLGTNSQGEPLMVGASNGRTYKGRRIYGVSVFDFQLPEKGSNSKFLGYSCIPTVSC